jgi:thioredoxin-like negative regulator of GroEL
MGKIIVCNFIKEGDEKCKVFAPIFEKLAVEFTLNAIFAIVDCDKVPELSQLLDRNVEVGKEDAA